MECPTCSQANPSHAKFCLECGAALPRSCRSCGTELPATAKFCVACGNATAGGPESAERDRAPADYTPRHLAEQILQSRSALEGERKQVTVMFADVKGSMELAEGMDPEEWHGILDGFFKILADGVHRFEGTVNQYTGDGIMALFGAPLAHEDHAQRACYAALHLREELDRYATEVKREHGIGVSVRMGLNSGEVIVGKIGDDLRMDYTAQGHTVGLAQRMESLASPDTCYLSDATAVLATGYFALEHLGEFDVKDATEPVVVHRLEGIGDARTRFDVARSRGLTRFVGRDADMRLADDALAQARAGNGQAVGIVAPAGTGKSRLCFEFSERCKSEGLEVYVGRAVAHGKNIPLLPILEIFRAYFGVEDDDSDRTVREKVAGKLLLIDEALREELLVLFEFFGVADPNEPALRLEAEARQRKLFGLMHRLARDDQAESPRVYLLEDLHWLDQASEAFVEQLVEAISGTRNLLLLNFRPEYHAGWMGRSWYRQLPLAPLGPDAIRELLEDLLGTDASTHGLADTIHARTGGNPFFTEEVVQSLIEAGVLEGSRGAYRLVTPIDELRVPPSVQAVLSARIDRLPERDKRTLQAASVIGKDFTRPILEAVVDEPPGELDAALASLREAEFLYEQSIYPVAEYTFKHPLTQEVTQSSLLRERRRELHGRVARAIEHARADALDENAALLAHHWDEADDARTAAAWYRRAADWIGHSDAAEAVRHWQRVRELLADASDADSQELRLAACRGILSRAFRLGADLTEVYEEGRAMAERSGDRDVAALMLLQYGRSLASRGEGARYVEIVDEYVRLAHELTDPAIRATALTFSLDAGWWAGDVDRMLRARNEFLDRYPPDPEFGIELWGWGLYLITLIVGGSGLAWGARFEEAEADLTTAAELGVSQGQLEIPVYTNTTLAEIAWLRGDARAAQAAARRVSEYAERSGAADLRVYPARAAIHAALAAGEWTQAEHAAETLLSIYAEGGVDANYKPDAHVLLSDALCRGDRFADALEAAERGLALAQQIPRPNVELQVRLHHAVSLVHTGAPAEAARSLERASELLDVTGAEALRPLLHEARADVAEALGDAPTRERELREALRIFTEQGSPGRALQIERKLEG